MKRLLLGLLVAPPSFAQLQIPTDPSITVESIQLSDGSTLRELVFTTTPGVNYSLYHSNDLENWNFDRRFYGLGHQIAIPVHLSDPVAGNSTPLLEAKPPVSMWLTPISGSSGDYFLSWVSLEDGSPKYHRLDGLLNNAWLNAPLSSHRLENFQLYVALSASVPVSEVPADTESIGQDQVLLTEFVDGLVEMNLDMSSGNFSGNEGVSSSVTSEERNFWRIQSDWHLDSDYDGTPDWLEHYVANTPDHPDRENASILHVDKNENGIPDGKETDSDRDGVNDEFDSSPADRAIDWPKKLAPKYAAFTFSVPIVPPRGPYSTRPLQVNQRGEILYPNGVWEAGTFHLLNMEGPGIQFAQPLGINSLGEIIGVAQTEGIVDVTNPPSGGGGVISPGATGICYWENRDAAPQLVYSKVGDDDVLALSPGWDTLTELFPHDSVIDDDGRFIGRINVADGSLAYYKKGNNGFEATEISEENDGLLYVLSPDVAWGSSDERGSFIVQNNSSTEVDFELHKVIRKPENQRLLAIGAGISSQLDDGSWVAPSKGSCLDLTQSGLWISSNIRVLFRDQKFTKKASYIAPKIPQEWDAKPGLFDASPNDFLLGRREQNDGNAAYLSSIYYPFILQDDVPDTGVDWQSAQATSGTIDNFSTPDAEGRFWAMAPALAGTGEENTFFISSPASADHPITLSAPGVTINPNVLTAPLSEVKISSAGNATQDVDLQISINDQFAVSQPIGIKIMKKRTVKIAVWRIALARQGGIPPNDRWSPNIGFTEENIEEELNRVFGKQTNTFFDVEMHGDLVPYRVAWDIGQGPPSTVGNGILDLTGGLNEASPGPGTEGAFVMGTSNQRYSENASINLYIIGGNVAIPLSYANDDAGSGYNGVFGVGMPGSRTAWINGMTVKLSPTPQEKAEDLKGRLSTIAHEVGHIMLGAGHPGNGPFRQSSGASPLPGTDHQKRLMYATRPNGDLLVKLEWDRIDSWLVKEETAGRITP